MFFNRQYFTKRVISDFDFWDVHTLERKKQGMLTGFLKKVLFGQMGPKIGPKISHPYNS